jgi:hypothetical protein
LSLEVLEARVVPSFVAPRSYDTGLKPRSVAVGDFTGQGILDLAITSYDEVGRGAVKILLGNGDGSFQAPTSYTLGSVGTITYSVAVGDFNGDGLPDLAVASTSGSGLGAVSILLSNGDGSFQAPTSYTIGLASGVESLAVGDFTGDGNLDLAVANETSNSVSVLLGNGDGAFQAARTFAAGTQPHSVAVGDFNGDGLLDLAVADYGNPFTGNGAAVSVLLGNGDGAFQAAQTFPAGSHPQSVAVGDFNGDGIPDLAVGHGAVSGDNTVSVLLGNGDGSFQAPDSYATGSAPVSVAVGDFNGDGISDLGVAGSSGVSVLLGNGDGSFQAPHTFVAGSQPVSVAVGDFNGDNDLDLAVVNQGSTNVSVLLGNGDGSFQDVAPSFAAGSGPESVAVGDFTGAGLGDLAVANEYSNTVSVLLGNGDGSFQDATSNSAGTRPVSVAVGDFNGDGILDLAVADQGTAPDYRDGSVSVLLGNGDGTFQAPRSFPAGSEPTSVAVGDFNGDGTLDLAVTNFIQTSDTVSVLLGNGDGTFQVAQSYAVGIQPESVAVGDFNGDGIPDLAVANRGTPNNYTNSSVSVLLGNGDGTFQTARSFATGRAPYAVAVGDFNGDGFLDLAVANNVGNSVSVLLGNGDGSFQAAVNYATGSSPASVAVGDFNGDGLPDLAVAGTGGTRVLLGNGDGSFQTTYFSYGTGPSTSVAVGDFNRDGLPDLAVTNSASNSVVILTNDGLWNGPAPRGGRPPGRSLGPLGSALVSPRLPDTRFTDTSPSLDLPPNPEPPRPIPEVRAGISTTSELVSAPRPVATLRPARAAEVLDVSWGLPDWSTGPPEAG